MASRVDSLRSGLTASDGAAEQAPGCNSRRVDGVAFTTALETPRRQFEAYRAQCAPVIELLPYSDGETAAFLAQFEMWRLGPLALRRIVTPPGRFVRPAAQVRKDGLDHWVINVLQYGVEQVRTERADFCAKPSALSVFSLACANEVQRTNVDWIGLFVPRGTVPRLDRALDVASRLELDNAQGRLIAAHLRTLAAELPLMSEVELPASAEITLAMIRSLTLGEKELADQRDPKLDDARLVYLEELIDQHLGSWTLNARKLARLSGISRSALYRIFEPHGGVARYIHRERLRRAHDTIEREMFCNIGNVAAALGFADASGFTRAFRKEFGYSPSELRQTARRPIANPAEPTRSLGHSGAWDLLG